MSRRAAGAVLALAAAAGVLATAGCSSSPSTKAAPTTSSTTATPATTTRPSTTTSAGKATTSSTATTAPGPTTCLADHLSGSVAGGSGAAGTLESYVKLTNTTSATCSLAGYPGMQLLSSSGADLPTVVIRGGVTFGTSAANQAPATVVLAAGQSAEFTVHYSDVPVGGETSCPTSAEAEVTPPNDYATLLVALQIAPCGGGTVHVSPVYAATS